jgi:hypothetical protein
MGLIGIEVLVSPYDISAARKSEGGPAINTRCMLSVLERVLASHHNEPTHRTFFLVPAQCSASVASDSELGCSYYCSSLLLRASCFKLGRH